MAKRPARRALRAPDEIPLVAPPAARTWNDVPLDELVMAGRAHLRARGAVPAGAPAHEVMRMDVRVSPVVGAEHIRRAVEVYGFSSVEAAFALVGLGLRAGFTESLAGSFAQMLTRARRETPDAAAEVEELCSRLRGSEGGELLRRALLKPVSHAHPAASSTDQERPVAEAATRTRLARARLKDVLPWLDRALRPVLPASTHAPPLDSDDLRLALRWLKRSEVVQPVHSLDEAARAYRDDRDLGRMLSARMAEKAAEAFYRRHGLEVRNVSLGQLNGGPGAWVTHDLVAGGRPVDVKNSRRSFSSPGTFVEHCVPEFKEVRQDQGVTITAVLSPRKSVPALLNADFGPFDDEPSSWPVLVLGELTRERLAALQSCFPPREHLRVEFTRSGNEGEFFPPWAFDAPAFVTAARDHALRQVPSDAFADPGPWRELGLNPLPLAVSTGHPWGGGFDHPWEVELYDGLRRAMRHAAETAAVPWGLSLPFVFLAVLDHFTRVLSGALSDEGYQPAACARFLFARDKDTQTPLGIPDPLRTVHALLETLEMLWHGSREEARTFSRFRLRGMRVLKGSGAGEGREQTLVAYCGGWTRSRRTGNRVRCGQSPLVLGRERDGGCRPCPRCGFLVCPTCLFCTRNCPGIQEREQARSVVP